MKVAGTGMCFVCARERNLGGGRGVCGGSSALPFTVYHVNTCLIGTWLPTSKSDDLFGVRVRS